MVPEADNVFLDIVASMSEGVIFLDRDDVIRVCNPAAEQIRRVQAAKIVGRPIYQLHNPRQHEAIRELIASLRSGTVASVQRTIQAQGRYFENSYVAIWSPQREFRGTLLISRDITEQRRLHEENLLLRHDLAGDADAPVVVRSEPMQKLLELLEAVAPLDSTLLVSGENGTGKEVLVELAHRLSPRRNAPLVKVNCAALPEQLLESELFGHIRGAFTGAVHDRKGKFELAHGGTLFLDEIGELPLLAQSKLLRAIQDKAVQPVGGRREIRVDVRIIVATNRDLHAEVAAGRFREDLFYRLNVIHLEIPPLRERRADILPLAEAFVERFCRQMKRPPRKLSPQVSALLLNHPFPGNVRQLRHAMERAVALGKGTVIVPADLPDDLQRQQAGPQQGSESAILTLKQALDEHEKTLLQQALAQHAGKKGLCAVTLGISRKSLWEKLRHHGLAEVSDS